MLNKIFFLKKNKNLFLILGIIFIGTFLRFYHLGYQGLWTDEARCVIKSNPSLFRSWVNFIKNNPSFEPFNLKPLYCKLLGAWVDAVGTEEWKVRFPSAIFGVLSILLAYKLGALIFNQKVGLLASFLISISPIHIYYSQEAKPYTFLLLLFLISFYLFYLALKQKKYIYWFSYIFFVILWSFFVALFYMPIFFILILTMLFCYFCFYLRNVYNIYKFLIIFFCILAIFLFKFFSTPWSLLLEANPWIQSPDVSFLVKTFKYFTLLSWKLPQTKFVTLALWIGLPIYLSLFFMVMIPIVLKFFCRNTRDLYSETKPLLTVIFCLFVPFIALFIISIIRPIYVPGRIEFILSPLFFLLISFAFIKIKNKFLQKIIFSGVILSTLICLYSYYFVYYKSNDRLVARYLLSYAGNKDILVFTNLTINPFFYYVPNNSYPNVYSFPDKYADYLKTEALKADNAYVNLEIKRLKDKIYPLLSLSNKLWVMHSPMKINKELLQVLNKDLEPLDTIEFISGDNSNQTRNIHIFRKCNLSK